MHKWTLFMHDSGSFVLADRVLKGGIYRTYKVNLISQVFPVPDGREGKKRVLLDSHDQP
jgi:hypothetical protein